MEFLKYVIKDLIEQPGLRMEDLTIVLPTRRAGVFLKNHLGELSADRPVCAPRCTTLSDLFDELCPVAPADDIKSVCLLYDIFCREVQLAPMPQAQPFTLDSFYGWGRQLINDFDNIDKNFHDSTPQNILQSATDARQFDLNLIDPKIRERLGQLLRGDSFEAIDEEEQSFRHNFQEIWSKLPRIYDQLNERLNADNAMLEGQRYKYVVTHLDELSDYLAGRQFVFVGFNILLKTEKRLMQLLKDRSQAMFYWDYDEEASQAEPHIDIYHHVEENIRQFGGKFQQSTRTESRPRLMIVSAASDNAQARYVNHWLETNHNSGEKSAVVLCNEGLLSAVVFSVPENLSGNLNITKGYPLSQTQIYSDIAQWLNNPANTHQDDLLETAKALLGHLDRQRESLAAHSTPDLIEWNHLLAIESLFQARTQVVRFCQLLEDGTLPRTASLHTLRNLLLAHLRSQTIPFHGEPVTDIQIIGMLETRTLDFDNLLLLNVEEGILPRTQRDHSFIPYYLRKYFGLTTQDEQSEVYAYNFFRLLARARNITLMYSEAQTAEGQKTASRFVLQILTSQYYKDRYEIVRHQLKENPLAAKAPVIRNIDQLLLSQSPYKTYLDKLIDNKRQSPDTTPTLSPSAISRYLGCPMSFFLRYMLNLRESERQLPLVATNDLGTLIHGAIEAAYHIILNSNSGEVSEDDIKIFLASPLNIEKAIDTSIAELNRDREQKFLKEEHLLEVSVVARHLRKVLENDQRLGRFRILGQELWKTCAIDIEGLGSIAVGGYIDRLDEVEQDGKRVVRVVDYKTGAFSPEKMKAKSLDQLFEIGTEQGYPLQTLIYSQACLEDEELKLQIAGRRIMPTLLFTRRNLADFNPCVQIADQSVLDFSPLSEAFKTKLEQLINNILQERDFQMSTNPDTCQSCPYALLCGR